MLQCWPSLLGLEWKNRVRKVETEVAVTVLSVLCPQVLYGWLMVLRVRTLTTLQCHNHLQNSPMRHPVQSGGLDPRLPWAQYHLGEIDLPFSSSDPNELLVLCSDYGQVLSHPPGLNGVMKEKGRTLGDRKAGEVSMQRAKDEAKQE